MRFLRELVFGIKVIKLLIEETNLSRNLEVSVVHLVCTDIDYSAKEQVGHVSLRLVFTQEERRIV